MRYRIARVQSWSENTHPYARSPSSLSPSTVRVLVIDSSKIIQNRVVSDLFVQSHTDLFKKTLLERQVA